mmetsp:Transcript_34288/g.60001  ORF Transcript_34288/g.60001 Transcript_34288/m.60001 type:complete len:218 (+) Transcript_34288:3663-4316(+)
MSVVLGKRNRIDEATEDRGSWTEKRRRKVGYQPSRELVELVCQQRSDKLRKLQQLFPTMEPHILDKVLSDCQENLELSIQLLSSLRLEPSDPAKDYASELIQSLTAVSSREEAESLATRAFQSFAHRVKQQEQAELISQNQQLSGQLQILLNDNALLKRAILKLNAKLQDLQAVEHDNVRLQQELQQERLAAYALKVHLQKALSGELSGQRDRPDVF